jgi:hypothetical protein
MSFAWIVVTAAVIGAAWEILGPVGQAASSLVLLYGIWDWAQR